MKRNNQINIILRTDSSNDLRNAMAIIEMLWNKHFAKAEGYMKVIFLRYDPNYSEKELQGAQEEAKRFFKKQDEETT